MYKMVFRSNGLIQLYLQEHILFLPVVFILGLLLYRGLLHPLAKFPGPFLAQFSGFWRTIRYAKGEWHDEVLDLHRKYGRVVRIAPNELSIVDENAMKQLYGHGKGVKKTEWYGTFDVPGAGPGVFAVRDPSVHSFLRKRLAGAYSMSHLLKYEEFIQGSLDRLFEKFQSHVDRAGPEGATLNMADWTNAFAFDVVGELAYGEPLGHIETESDVMGLRELIYTGFYLQSNLGHIPGQIRLVNNSVSNFISRSLGLRQVRTFIDWSQEKVLARLESGEKADRQDLLSHFTKMKKVNGDPAGLDEILIEALNIVGAGADTTSIGMRSCLYCVAQHPGVFRRVQEEVDKFYQDNHLTKPISYTQIQHLPYTQAVVKEAMRLYPSIVYQLPRHAPAGIIVDGKTIPEGTPVGISAKAQNRDPAIWGNDADEFRPERWLVDEATARKLDSLSMTFGGNGPRMCLGKNLALIELHKFLAQLSYHFNISFSNPDRPWRVKSLWFAFQHDMYMQLRARPGRRLVA